MKGIKTAVELDARLAEVLSVLHHAYALFNGWEETEGHGQFYDENLETVGKVSEGFGLLESDSWLREGTGQPDL